MYSLIMVSKKILREVHFKEQLNTMMAYLPTESKVVNTCLAKYWLLFLPIRIIFTFLTNLILRLDQMPLSSFFCFSSFAVSLATGAAASSDFRVDSKLFQLFRFWGMILICFLLLEIPYKGKSGCSLRFALFHVLDRHNFLFLLSPSPSYSFLSCPLLFLAPSHSQSKMKNGLYCW